MKETSLKRPALYNPALWSRDEVRTYYVARPKLLERFLDDFRREQPGTRPQHRLILGQRGMGKSTLLRRLAIGVEDDSGLAARWLPLSFPEEQYNVATLADFWLNCLDALGDWLEARGEIAKMQALDAEIERLDRKDGEGALQALLRQSVTLQRRLLLLVDNIDLILDRLKDKDWVLREALQDHPELMLVGASSKALESTYDYGAAFYDFFRIDELRGLSEDEMRETIYHLARLRGADDLIQRLEADPSRLHVLHVLTGGNPRTAVLLYGVLLKGGDGDVRSDLEGLLDEVTPLYKARFDELPTQAQQLLDKLALHWDPMSARQAADALGWQVNLVSAQLERLVQSGVVEKVKSGTGKRMAFQVAERFFNIWYLMRASRRVRRKLMWLVEFLRVSFSPDELHRLAVKRLQANGGDTAEAEYMLAICRAIGPAAISSALETSALHCLIARERGRLGEILDLSGEDKDLLPRIARIQARRDLAVRMKKLLGERTPIVERFCGLPVVIGDLLGIVDELEKGTTQDLSGVIAVVEEVGSDLSRFFGSKTYLALSEAIAAGDMADLNDTEGAAAASLRLGLPILAIFSELLKAGKSEIRGDVLEKLANEALAEDDSGTYFWLNLTRALASQGRLEDARRSAEAALERDPEEISAKVQLCSIEFQAGALGRAKQLAREVCTARPNRYESWFVLAKLLFGDAECPEEQLMVAKRLVELEPNDPSAYWMLANSFLAQGVYGDAMVAAKQWLILNRDAENVDSNEMSELVALLQGVVVTKQVSQFLKIAEESGAIERLRPAYEALLAVQSGGIDVLNDIAPEVRKPATDLLRIIAPSLLEASKQPL